MIDLKMVYKMFSFLREKWYSTNTTTTALILSTVFLSVIVSVVCLSSKKNKKKQQSKNTNDDKNKISDDVDVIDNDIKQEKENKKEDSMRDLSRKDIHSNHYDNQIKDGYNQIGDANTMLGDGNEHNVENNVEQYDNELKLRQLREQEQNILNQSKRDTSHEYVDSLNDVKKELQREAEQVRMKVKDCSHQIIDHSNKNELHTKDNKEMLSSHMNDETHHETHHEKIGNDDLEIEQNKVSSLEIYLSDKSRIEKTRKNVEEMAHLEISHQRPYVITYAANALVLTLLIEEDPDSGKKNYHVALCPPFMAHSDNIDGNSSRIPEPNNLATTKTITGNDGTEGDWMAGSTMDEALKRQQWVFHENGLIMSQYHEGKKSLVLEAHSGTVQVKKLSSKSIASPEASNSQNWKVVFCPSDINEKNQTQAKLKMICLGKNVKLVMDLSKKATVNHMSLSVNVMKNPSENDAMDYSQKWYISSAQ